MKRWILRCSVVVPALVLLTASLFATGQQEPAGADGIKTITVATYHAASDSMDFSETAVGQKILDEIGIKVEVIGKPAETDQAVLTDMAAGNLPDLSVFWVAEGDPVFQTMIKGATEGQLSPLEDAIREHSPVLSYVLDREDLGEEIADYFYRPEFDGETYILPTHYGLYSSWISGQGLFIRGDVADQLGIPTPDYSIETTDDLIALLTRIKDAGVTDINGNPAYPMGSFTWNGVLFGDITKPFDFGGTDFVGLQNGRVEAFINTDYAWENILFVRTLIERGLLDPEMFTDSYQRMTEKIAQGRYAIWPIFASFAVTPATAYIQSLLEAAPQMAYRPLGNMFNHMGNRDSYHYNHVSGGLGWAVSATADVEAAIRLVDWVNTWDGRASLRYGIEGEHWFENADGYPEMLPDAYAAIRENPQAFAEEVGAVVNGSALYLLSEATGLDDPNYDVTSTGVDDDRYYHNSPDNLNAIVAGRNATMPNQNITAKVPFSSIFPEYADWDQFKPAWDQWKDIMFQCYLVDSESEAMSILENYRNTLDGNGYDDFIAFLQDAYDRDPEAFADYINW